MKSKKVFSGKVLAMALAVIMAISIIPTTVFAAEPTELIVNGESIESAENNTVACGDGTAVYDKDAKTITLTNATLTKLVSSSYSYTMFIPKDMPTTIILVGKNTIADTIFSYSDLVIEGSSKEESILNGNGLNHCPVNACDAALTVKDCTMNLNSFSALSGDTFLTIENSNINSTAYDAPIWSGGDLDIKNSNIDVEATDIETNAVCAWGTLTITDSEITSKSDYAALYGHLGIVLNNTKANVTSFDSAIFTPQTITVTGGEVTANGYYCGLEGDAGISISGTKVDSKSSNTSSIYSDKNISITDGADLTLVGYWCGIVTRETLDIENSKVDATSTDDNDWALYANGAITMTNSDITAKGYGGVGSDSTISADGSKLKLTASTGKGINSTGATTLNACEFDIDAAYGTMGSDSTTSINMTDCTGILKSTTKGAVFAKAGITIDGEKTDLTISSEKGTAIYCEGELTYDGGKLNVSSVESNAINVYNGKINYVGGTLNSTAPIAAYTFVTSDTQPADIDDLITVNENYKENAEEKVLSTGWFKQGDQWAFKTSFVSADAEELATDLSNASSTVNIKVKGADYTNVDKALAKIPADLSIYTDESVKALNDAKDAIVTGKDITEQETVDAYGANLEKAIIGLKEKQKETITDKDTDTDETDTKDATEKETEKKTDESKVSPSTGNESYLSVFFILMLLSAGVLIIAQRNKKKATK